MCHDITEVLLKRALNMITLLDPILFITHLFTKHTFCRRVVGRFVLGFFCVFRNLQEFISSIVITSLLWERKTQTDITNYPLKLPVWLDERNALEASIRAFLD